ncbi:MAG: hypothetical protein JRH20_26465, partial [Deltaproteobacteria bacterium]|nr:hypothetical protein [Deltaproteobacteria bacterium]
MKRSTCALLSCVVLLATACTEDNPALNFDSGADSALPGDGFVLDQGTPADDGALPTGDSTTPTGDGTTPTGDGTTPTGDGATPTADGTTPTADGTTANPDTGPATCTDPTPCEGYACDLPNSVCYTTCSSRQQCAVGYTCNASGTCVEEVVCTADTNCFDGYACNLSTGECFSRCQNSDQCADNYACNFFSGTC